MADQPKASGSHTTGGALNIPDDRSVRIGSDAELKGADNATAQDRDVETASADPAAPVERFDPPAPEGNERIFQNGDTDR